MKCPKCHYLSFEPEPRCRNCGYDLELADADLSLRDPEPEDVPARDLRLHDPIEHEAPALVAAAPAASARLWSEPADVAATDRPPRPPRPSRARSRASAFAVAEAPLPLPVDSEPEARPSIEREAFPVAVAPPPPLVAVPPRPGRAPSTTSEMPLFVKGIAAEALRDSDEPLVSAPAAPRPPLSVRRRAQEPARIEPSSPELLSHIEPPLVVQVPTERDVVADVHRAEDTHVAQAKAEARALVRAARREAQGDVVGPGPRLAAAGIDLVLLAGIAMVVLALTLRLCDLPLAEAAVLPVVPLGAFVLLIGLGYLWLFTAASGQTIGKMVLGLKVVASPLDKLGTTLSPVEGSPADVDRADRLTMAQAASRVLWTVPSVLALGLGFVLAFVGDGRTLHDRLSHTRVVRA